MFNDHKAIQIVDEFGFCVLPNDEVIFIKMMINSQLMQLNEINTNLVAIFKMSINTAYKKSVRQN